MPDQIPVPPAPLVRTDTVTLTSDLNDILAWVFAGYDVHPIIPPGVELHPNSKIEPKSRGKVPGAMIEGSEMWTGIHWQRPRAERMRLQQGEGWAASFLTGNGGVRSDNRPAIDIDCLDGTLSAKLRALALRECGPAPIRIGMPPKCLLVYAAAPDELEQPTRVFRWKKPGHQPVGVELLAAGRQYVVKGVHPGTMMPYAWDCDPIAVAEDGLLTPLTAEKVRAFIDAMRALMRAEDWDLDTVTASGGGRRTMGLEAPPAASLRAHDMAVLAKAVEAIPNPPDAPREDYIAMGYALKAAAGTDREMEGFLLWHEWAERWEPDDPARANTMDGMEKDWARLKPPFYIGAEYVYDLAVENGWSRLEVLKHDFEADPLPAVEVAAAEAQEERRKKRPLVVLGSGSKDATLDAFGAAVAADPHLVRNVGGELQAVRVGASKPTDRPGGRAEAVRFPDATPVLDIATPSDVFLAVCRHADIAKPGRGGELVPCDPPRELVKDYLNVRRGTDARLLAGMSPVPDIDDDGSIDEAAGYNAETGMLHLPCPPITVPAVPNAAEVQAAARALAEPFRCFPYADPKHGPAVVLALTITALRRPFLPSSPMFLVTAPAPGSGKGLLISSACHIALGTGPTTFTYGPDPAEQEKRLAAALLAGSRAILIDNANGAVIEGDLIESALTTEKISIRPLGVSRQMQVGTNTLMMATGNHAAVGGDMARRTIVIDLDPACERPELRTFGFDPRQMVQQQRPRLLSAVFVLMRAFRQAGWPTCGAPPLGSYERWSREVRDLVAWVSGGVDIVATMTASRDADPRRQADGAILAALVERFGDRAFTGTDVAAWANAAVHEGGLGEAIGVAFQRRPGQPVSAPGVGYWARRTEKVVVAGLRLTRERDARSGANTYRVARVDR